MPIQAVTGAEAGEIQLKIDDALQDPNIPKIYMNGFNIGQTLSDIFIGMQLGKNMVGVINMSFTTAKTLMIGLQETISKFEEKTAQPLLTMKDIQTKSEGV